MAERMSILVNRAWCSRANQTTELREDRLAPADLLPDLSPPRVVARRCSLAIDCNMAGIPCSWAFTNPGFDPFDVA